MTSYVFRVMAPPHYPCLIPRSGDLYPYAPLIMVSSRSASIPPPRTDHTSSAEHYLQSPLQLEHACQLLLDSELFVFHSERMCELAIDDVQSVCGTTSVIIGTVHLTLVCRKRTPTDSLFCIAFYYFGADAKLPSFVATNDGNLSSHY